jgi:hypothetical protein
LKGLDLKSKPLQLIARLKLIYHDNRRRFMSKIKKLRTGMRCWQWTGSLNEKGYGQVWWDGRMRRANRVAHELFIGPIPEGLEVCHDCDNRGCVNPRHLVAGTHQKNMADAVQRVRLRGHKGEEHPMHKLNEADVRKILWLLKQGIFQRKLATTFGVTQACVSLIARGKTWSHLKTKGK